MSAPPPSAGAKRSGCWMKIQLWNKAIGDDIRANSERIDGRRSLAIVGRHDPPTVFPAERSGS
jgi:hypothetical protein